MKLCAAAIALDEIQRSRGGGEVVGSLNFKLQLSRPTKEYLLRREQCTESTSATGRVRAAISGNIVVERKQRRSEGKSRVAVSRFRFI